MLGHTQSLRANHGSLIMVSLVAWVTAWVLRSYEASQFTRLRAFSFFLAFFAAFFSFGVIRGCFFASLLLFCSLPMMFAPV